MLVEKTCAEKRMLVKNANAKLLFSKYTSRIWIFLLNLVDLKFRKLSIVIVVFCISSCSLSLYIIYTTKFALNLTMITIFPRVADVWSVFNKTNWLQPHSSNCRGKWARIDKCMHVYLKVLLKAKNRTKLNF